MSYEKELEYLRKEFKNSEAKFHEAEREGWHTDANIYKDNMENFEYQIHMHEQAAKADEYKAKAEAWDKLMFEIDEINDEATVREIPPKIIMVAKITVLSNVMKEYESGESNE